MEKSVVPTEFVFPTGSKPKSPILTRMIELMVDVNLTMDEVDQKLMAEFPVLLKEGWHIGSTREKVKKYPILARTASEARALLWREVGVCKKDVFQVYADGMKAEKRDMTGSTDKDHEIRMKAADRVATLMGESVNPAGAKTNISVTGADAKILIQTSDGKPVPFPQRPEGLDT